MSKILLIEEMSVVKLPNIWLTL